MRYMLEGQESERNRIAKDLHDGLGGLLSSVKAHFGMIQSEIHKIESLNIYDKAQTMMDNACDEVRRISHNLMPPLLESQGLVVAVSNMMTNYEASHDVTCKLDIRNMDERLPETIEIFAYRICQELLNNISKHASASHIEISMYGLHDCVQIIMEDDGKGFLMDEINDGLGLVSIKSRIEYLNGEIEIDSILNKGTTITMTIPK
ncbi:MAG: sensor histidine kinase [Saprospiraceae bacterium]